MAFIGYMTTFLRIGWLECIEPLVCKYPKEVKLTGASSSEEDLSAW